MIYISDNQISTAHSIIGVSKGRPKDDFYPTPPYATIALLEREKFGGNFLEPCCGDGSMSEVIQKYYPNQEIYSYDLYDRGYGLPGYDFLTTDFSNMKIDNIITNPPFNLAQEFVEKSLEIANKKVALLMKIQFLEGAKRYHLFKSTPLEKVYVFSKRLTFSRNGVKLKNSGMICYSWFVWNKDYKGEPIIDWII